MLGILSGSLQLIFWANLKCWKYPLW